MGSANAYLSTVTYESVPDQSSVSGSRSQCCTAHSCTCAAAPIRLNAEQQKPAVVAFDDPRVIERPEKHPGLVERRENDAGSLPERPREPSRIGSTADAGTCSRKRPSEQPRSSKTGWTVYECSSAAARADRRAHAMAGGRSDSRCRSRWAIHLAPQPRRSKRWPALNARCPVCWRRSPALLRPIAATTGRTTFLVILTSVG